MQPNGNSLTTKSLQRLEMVLLNGEMTSLLCARGLGSAKIIMITNSNCQSCTQNAKCKMQKKKKMYSIRRPPPPSPSSIWAGLGWPSCCCCSCLIRSSRGLSSCSSSDVCWPITCSTTSPSPGHTGQWTCRAYLTGAKTFRNILVNLLLISNHCVHKQQCLI